MRILIVDDDEQVCQVLQSMLSSWGMMVKGMANPLLVADELRETFYNLVLLDVIMPHISGLDLLVDIGRLYPDTKTIIMTGHTDKNIAIKALKLGACDFLEKPISMDLLFHAVKRALDTQKIELEHKKTLEDNRYNQQELLKKTLQLERLTRELTDTNTALSVLVQNMERMRQEEKNQLTLKIRSLILPVIARISQDKHLQRYETQLDLLLSYIKDLTTGLATNLHITTALSLSEQRIAAMIRHGMTDKQIGAHLFIAPTTVKTHRRNIRKKLRLTGTQNNLRAYLRSIEQSATVDYIKGTWPKRIARILSQPRNGVGVERPQQKAAL